MNLIVVEAPGRFVGLFAAFFAFSFLVLLLGPPGTTTKIVLCGLVAAIMYCVWDFLDDVWDDEI